LRHRIFPVLLSRHDTTSHPATRVWTWTLPLATTGEEYPAPTSDRHLSFSFCGQAAGAEKSSTRPSRFGPRHCVHSCAATRRLCGAAARPQSNGRNHTTIRGVTLHIECSVLLLLIGHLLTVASGKSRKFLQSLFAPEERARVFKFLPIAVSISEGIDPRLRCNLLGEIAT